MTEAERKQLRREFATSGGKARAASMSAKQRKEAASRAAQARWSKAKQQQQKGSK